jgi:hypothetical protein
MATIYDSRAFVMKLVETGMPEGQADTLASENLVLIAEHLATKDEFKAAFAQVATKEELLATKDELHAEITALRAEMVTKAEFQAYMDSLRAEIDSLENKLLLKLSGILVVLLTLFRLI